MLVSPLRGFSYLLLGFCTLLKNEAQPFLSDNKGDGTEAQKNPEVFKVDRSL